MIKRARQTDALALAARKPNTPLPDERVKTGGHFRFDKVEYLCGRACFTQSRWIDLIVGQAKRHVAGDCVVDKKNILRHVTDGSLP